MLCALHGLLLAVAHLRTPLAGCTVPRIGSPGRAAVHMCEAAKEVIIEKEVPGPVEYRDRIIEERVPGKVVIQEVVLEVPVPGPVRIEEVEVEVPVPGRTIVERVFSYRHRGASSRSMHRRTQRSER